MPISIFSKHNLILLTNFLGIPGVRDNEKFVHFPGKNSRIDPTQNP